MTRHDVLRITNAALRFRFTEKSAGAGAKAGAGMSEKKGPSVWVLENEKPKRVSITPGISDGTYTEVAAGDLKEDQTVIVEAMKKGNKTQGSSGPRMF